MTLVLDCATARTLTCDCAGGGSAAEIRPLAISSSTPSICILGVTPGSPPLHAGDEPARERSGRLVLSLGVTLQQRVDSSRVDRAQSPRPGSLIATVPIVRPNKVGWFLVALFGIGGFFFWRTIPEIWIGQIWMGVAALLAVLYVVMTIRANKANKLAITGTRGHADILEMSQTGTYINNQPRVKMRLRIQAPGVVPFEVEETVTVPLIALGALQPGRPLTVVLDPADPKEYVIDWSGNRGGPPITFQMEDGRTANLSGDAATTAAVMQILVKHGIQPGNMDLRGTPHIRNEVLGVIQRAGYFSAAPTSAAPQPGPQMPATPIPAATFGGDDDPDPAVRLTKLAQLRDGGAITAAEFEEHKRRILSDI